MIDLLKKYGVSASLAIIVVILLTVVPILYQIHYTAKWDAKIIVIEEKLKALEDVNAKK